MKIQTLKENKQVKGVLQTKHGIILIPEQILQKLPIALVQLKAGNTSENLLNEMRQILYSLHREKEITKKNITM